MEAEAAPRSSVSLPHLLSTCGTSNSTSASQSPALTAAHHVTWEKPFHLSEPRFPRLPNGDKTPACLHHRAAVKITRR